jgi:restriction endonuclease S subunit
MMEYVHLGRVARVFAGWQPQRDKAGPEAHRLPAISVRDLRDGHVATGELETVPVPVAGNLDRYLVQTGDVLVACRGTVPKVAIAPPELSGVVLTSTLIGVRLDSQLLPEVLFVYLRSAPGQSALLSRVRSGTQQIALTPRDLAALEVPLPPMATQRRIAELVRAAEDQYVAAEAAARLRRDIVHEVALAAMGRVSRSCRRD